MSISSTYEAGEKIDIGRWRQALAEQLELAAFVQMPDPVVVEMTVVTSCSTKAESL